MGFVYLIHFEHKLHHAQHYIGYTDNVEKRMKRHREGGGSKLISAITKAGIAWDLVRIWVGDRALERRLKNQKKARCLCPVCRQAEEGTNASCSASGCNVGL